MKTVIKLPVIISIYFIVFIMLLSNTFAQTNPPVTNPPTVNPSIQNPVQLSDPTLSQQLQSDLNSRNGQSGSQAASWFNTGSGYYGTYSLNNTDYLSRYLCSKPLH
jgi:hypothetical protein